MLDSTFDWDEGKNRINQMKHGVAFEDAQYAFADPDRVILEDKKHSQNEQRLHCFGKVDGDVMTVWFTYRDEQIRIIGAAYWRKGRKLYAKENSS